MKRLALAAAFAAMTATPAVAGIQDFTLLNQSGATITYIYVSANYDDSWGPDLLGNDVLYAGQAFQVQINGFGDHCWFDVLVEDENGGSWVYDEVDLCTVGTITYQ